MQPNRLLRTALAIWMAIAVPLDVSAQQILPYFRWQYGQNGLPNNPTPPEQNPDYEEGDGDLKIYTPVQVRARYDVNFALQLGVGGSTAGIRWESIGTPLPAGLQLTQTGSIVGRPTAVGTSPAVRVRATNGLGETGTSKPFIIDSRPTPTVTVPAMVSRDAGQATTVAPTKQEIWGSQTWSVNIPLPVGLSLDPRTGTITGQPEQKGMFSGYRLTVIDADGAVGTSNEFAFEIDSGLSIGGLQANYVGRLGQSFATVRPWVSGGTGPYSWSLSASSTPLPAGMVLNPNDGSLSGTPTAAGDHQGILLSTRDYASGLSLTASAIGIRVVPAPTVETQAAYAGRVGRPMEVIPVARNTIEGVTWAWNGPTIPGLTFNATTGRLSGTPSTTGMVTATVRATDHYDGASGVSPSFTVEAKAALGIAAAANRKGKVGVPFEAEAPEVTGLIGLPTWQPVGGLPAGLSLIATDGRIVGTPTAKSTVTLAYRVLDNADASQATSNNFSVEIVGENEPLPFEVNPMSPVYKVVVDRALGIVPTTTGATGPVTWQIEGPLPSWATFEPTTGRISGIPRTVQQYPNLRLTATDTASGNVARSDYFWIQADPKDPLSLSMTSFTAIEGQPLVSATPIVRNAVGMLDFTVNSASAPLPPGTVVNPSSGRIEGTPTIAGQFDGIVTEVIDAARGAASSAPFSITVGFPGNLSYRNTSGALAQPLEAAPRHGGLATPLTWRLAEDRTLPSWATLDATTGLIYGVPDKTGSHMTAVVVTDASGRSVQSNNFSLDVLTVPVLAASIRDLKGTIDVPFQESPQVSGYRGMLTWRIAGALPPGLTHDISTGRIHGTPTTLGTYPGLVLSVTDAAGGEASTEPFSITIGRSALTAYGPSGRYRKHVGHALTLPTPSAARAIGAVTWEALGNLPAGMGIAASTGVVSGTPTAIGTYENLTLRATDAAGGVDATAPSFSIEVVPMPSIEVASPYEGRYGYRMSFAPVARDTIGATTWTVASGSLPAWLTLNASSGSMSGVPNVMGAAPPFTLRVTDAEGASAVSSQIVVNVVSGMVATLQPLTFQGRVSQPFATASGGVVGNEGDVTWRLASGALPQWATFDSATGRIQGTPDAESQFSYSLTARDSTGHEASTQTATVTISPAPTIAVAPTTRVRVGAVLGLSPTTTGIRGTPSFALVEGTRPNWMTFSTANGQLAGSPTAIGLHSGFRMRLNDQGASATSGLFSIEATPGMTVSGLPEEVVLRQNVAMATPIQPTLTGAIGAVSWSATGVVQGMQVNGTTGRITGTPTGTSSVTTLTANDAHDNAKASGSVRFTIVPQPTVGAIPAVTVRVNESVVTQAPGVTGIRGTPDWEIAEGTLPSWAELDRNTGIVRGTPTTPQTITGVRLRVRDSWDQATGVSPALTITVLDEPAVINMATNYSARYGFDFISAPPTMTNAIGAVTWSWGNTATPPAWVTLDFNTGRMSGKPLTQTTTTNVTIQGRDSRGTIARSVPFALNIYNDPEIAIPTGSLTMKLRVGGGVYAQPTVTGVMGPATYEAAIESGAMPAGITVDGSNGRISGTATAAGAVTFRVRVIDVDGANAVSQLVSITVANPLTIAGLPESYEVRQGVRFDIPAPVVTGNQGTLNWTVTPRPSWLNVSATGSLNGTPTGSYGPSNVTLTATDPFDGRTVSQVLNLRAYASLVVAGTSNLPSRNGLDLGLSSWTPSVSGVRDQQALRWELGAGTLPNGVTVNPTTGRLVGQPTGYASTTTFANLSLKAIDVDGQAFSPTFTLTVYPTLTASIATTSHSTAGGQTVTTAIPSSTGVIGTRTWGYQTISGVPPETISQAANGSLTFTPTNDSVGTWVFAITVRDSIDGQVANSQSVSVQISETPTLTWAMPSATVRYQADLDPLNIVPTVTGLVGTVTYSASGAPSGTTFNTSTGRLSGNPYGGYQTYNVRVTARDSRNYTAVGILPLTVTQGITAPTYASIKIRYGRQSVVDPITTSGNILGSVTYNAIKNETQNGWSGLTYPHFNHTVDQSGRVTITGANNNCEVASGYSRYYVEAVDSADGSSAMVQLGYTCRNNLWITQQPSTINTKEGVSHSIADIFQISGVVNSTTVSATGLPQGLSASIGSNYQRFSIVGTPAAGTYRAEPYRVTITATDTWDNLPISSTTFDLYVGAPPQACPANSPAAGTTICSCSAGAVASGAIWGTDVYTSDSSICRAAAHAGRIPVATGGMVSVSTSGSRSSYTASTRYGITSNSYGSWGSSFYFNALP